MIDISEPPAKIYITSLKPQITRLNSSYRIHFKEHGILTGFTGC